MNGHDYPEQFDNDDNEDFDQDAALAKAMAGDPQFQHTLTEAHDRQARIEQLLIDFEREIDGGKSFNEAWDNYRTQLFRPASQVGDNDALIEKLFGEEN